MHLTSATQPNGRTRFSMHGTRMVGEPFIIHQEDEQVREEHTITDLLIGMLAFRLDRFTALAFDIPPDQRHEKHDQVFDKCAELVNLLTGVVGWRTREDCSGAMHTILPAYLYLLGRATWPGFVARKAEWEQLTRIAAMVKNRLDHPGPSCWQCFAPLAMGHSAKCKLRGKAA